MCYPIVCRRWPQGSKSWSHVTPAGMHNQLWPEAGSMNVYKLKSEWLSNTAGLRALLVITALCLASCCKQLVDSEPMMRTDSIFTFNSCCRVIGSLNELNSIRRSNFYVDCDHVMAALCAHVVWAAPKMGVASPKSARTASGLCRIRLFHIGCQIHMCQWQLALLACILLLSMWSSKSLNWIIYAQNYSVLHHEMIWTHASTLQKVVRDVDQILKRTWNNLEMAGNTILRSLFCVYTYRPATYVYTCF